jgi:integrase
MRNKNKIPQVYLLRRKLKDGRIGLAFGYHPKFVHDGKVHYRESINIYLNGGSEDPANLEIAKKMRDQKQVFINDLERNTKREKAELVWEARERLDFNTLLAEHTAYPALIRHWTEYSKTKIKLGELNMPLILGFKQYLETQAKDLKAFSQQEKLNVNTASLYFAYFKGVIKKLFQLELIKEPLHLKVPNIGTIKADTKRPTANELKALEKAPCDFEVYKRAALFSAQTGMSFCDIQALSWMDIQKGWVRYTRKKVRRYAKIVEVPLNAKALDLMGKRSQGLVFKGLKASTYYTNTLIKWKAAAKISSGFTFHGFRHYFGTTIQARTGDQRLVADLMGHSSLQNTFRYTKPNNEKKRKAVE